jgi:hypothetical protein
MSKKRGFAEAEAKIRYDALRPFRFKFDTSV